MASATDTAEKDPFGPPKAFDGETAKPGTGPNLVMLFFHGVASLRFTVALLFLGSLLVFFGTLAQVDQGIWQIMSKYFRSIIVFIPLDIFTVFSSTHGEQAPIPGAFPFPGGWTIGCLLMVNLVAAHALRFRLRVGILTLHAGLIILLLSEFITGLYAIETKMNINEGSSANFTYDTREAELVVIDTSDPDKDQVVAIPQSILRSGEVIEHEELPFDISVDSFFENSVLKRRKPQEETQATFGTGLFYRAVGTPVVSGTDQNQTVDVPAAYITLRKKGSDTTLGTCLASCQLAYPLQEEWASLPQKQTINGKTYELFLRYRRFYKSYELYLHDFSFDRYKGTNTPKNYSSRVQLVDPSRGEDREVLIWMNHPLRYQGETFFQSSFMPNETGTILQVVRNPGWLMPYISCTMISIGLMIHFSQTLFKFLRREMAK